MSDRPKLDLEPFLSLKTKSNKDFDWRSEMLEDFPETKPYDYHFLKDKNIYKLLNL